MDPTTAALEKEHEAVSIYCIIISSLGKMPPFVLSLTVAFIGIYQHLLTFSAFMT
jgi:hypothetical protein